MASVEDCTIGQDHRQPGEMRVVANAERALLRVTNTSSRDAEATLDPEAVVTGSREGGYLVTAEWTSARWWSEPYGTLILGEVGIAVDTCDLIDACLAAPNRTVRLADLPSTIPAAFGGAR